MSKYLFQSDSSAGRDFYSLLAPVYDPVAGPFLRPVRRAVARLAETSGCERILDVCCGTGEQAKMLARRGFNATGIDLSPSMLAQARTGFGLVDAARGPVHGIDRRGRGEGGERDFSHERGFSGGPSFILGNAEYLPFPSASFDCAVISLALHEMFYPVAVRVTREMLRVVKPGGKLLVFDYLRPKGFASAFSLALLHAVERFAGGNHFRNFKHFVSTGGIESFMEQFQVDFVSGQGFLGGATGLLVYQTL